jgi:nucleoside-diphosphate-sugar epimerase
MNHILITGGAGFIGSHLAQVLLASGKKVTVVDNLLTGARANIEGLLQNPNFEFVEHDVIKPLDSSNTAFSDVDAVFHLASPASPNAKSARSYISFPIETLLVNSIGTQNMLEFAYEHKARFLFASTSEVYGNPSVSPQPESYWGNVNPNGVRSVYDEAKRFGEAMTMAYLRRYDVDVRIVRIFNTYGDHMQKDDGRVVSNFINQALTNTPITIYGDGTQTRSLCFVDDLVEGLIAFMTNDSVKGEVINMGNPDEHTVKELAELIKQLTGSQSEIVYEPLPADDPMQRKPDITKAQNLLGFAPKVTIQDGLTRTIEYFKNL